MKHLTKLLFLFISISAFSQSPWTQKEGKFYTQLSFTTISNYDTLFGDPDYSNFGKYIFGFLEVAISLFCLRYISVRL